MRKEREQKMSNSLTYYYDNGISVALNNKIASGGEGVVYEIDDNTVAKIFDAPSGRLPKMEAFIRKRVNIEGVCTPMRLLFDEKRSFVGYTMQKAYGKTLQLSLFQPGLLREMFPTWTKIELSIIAIEILKKIIALHKQQILIGDINPNNIMVANYDKVFFLDSDSYQIDNYPCPVGTVNFSPPEIQGKNFSNLIRKKEHEYYAIATLLFMIFLTGKHPYSCVGGADIQENIINHEFAFPLADDDRMAAPKGQWEAMWCDLPFYLREQFYNVFKLNQRYSADIWKDLLEKYVDDLKSGKYSRDIFISTDVILRGRSVGMNTRDINPDKDLELRQIETPITNVNPPYKIAVMELSTKAVKLLIGDNVDAIRTQSFDFQWFYKQAQKTNTGLGLNEENNMDMEYYNKRVLPYIIEYRRIAQSKGVDCIYSVATAAYRTAKNRDEIIRTIREQANLNVRILQKKEEAEATMIAFRYSSPNRDELMRSEYVAMIDQGGGSTEVSLFRNNLRDNSYLEYQDSYSINLGTDVLRTLLFKEANAKTTVSQALDNVDKTIQSRLRSFYKNINKPDNAEIFCVAVGSAITSATGQKGNKNQHGKILTIDKIKDKIKTTDVALKEQYHSVNDLYYDLKNAVSQNNPLDSIVIMRVGLKMVLNLMEGLNIKQLTVSGTGLWYGIYYQQLFK